MIIKKFQGKTKEEALDLAYRELGNNVVEMNTRNVKKKGVFSFLRPQMVEVTVALEEEVQAPKTSQIAEAIAGVRSVAEASLIKEEKPAPVKEPEIKEPEPKVMSAIERLSASQQTQKGNSIDMIANEELMLKKTDNSVIEEKLDSLHNMLEAQLQKPERNTTPVMSDGMFSSKEKAPDQEKPSDEVEKFVKLLYNTMIDNEINEKYANQIIDEMEKIATPNMPFEQALANIYQKMILKFGNPASITPATKGPKVVFFVGPTGVGKTTTIAKIASKFSVEGGKKVCLLTADTYRIAAAEQLRTYANILEIPFRIIYSTEEVEQALRDFKDYDYILVDTAGHSHQNEAQREAMNGFIHSVDGIVEKEVFLVLSATTKYRDLISIADTYSSMTDYKLIFTKLDETTTLGNLLNIKLHTNAPLSYVTCGQNVPDDIENFNPQKTVKQLLGGRKG